MDDDAYLRHRDLVVRLAYDITGTWADAEDIASQVYLSWRTVPGPVRNPRAYLARMATHRALDIVAARDRLGYVGPYLPEPVLTGPGADDAIELADEVEIALMVVLGSLSPLERAAFLLHDVFAFSHPEVAQILGREPAAVRQLTSRARRHLADHPPPRQVPPAELTALVGPFPLLFEGHQISRVLVVRNPDKLTRLTRRLTSSSPPRAAGGTFAPPPGEQSPR